ncbi:MAG TPA: FecR domain-containing protein [Chthoniobacterales bacterium]
MKHFIFDQNHRLTTATRSRLAASLSVLLLVGAGIFSARATQLKDAHVTQIVHDVKLLPSQAAPRPAAVSDEVRDGTGVRTGVDSRAELTFTDLTLTRLGANTIFSFNEGTRNLELSGGAMLLRVPKNAGGAQIKTAAVTAAITGTTIMLEYHPDAYIKFIVLEGTGRMFRNDKIGESVLVHAGQMLIVNPKGKGLPDPVDVDVKRLMETSHLITDFGPLPSTDLITREIATQTKAKSSGGLVETNLVIFGGGTAVSLVDPTQTNLVDQANDNTQHNSRTQSGSSSETAPTPPPPTPTPTPTATPTVTPSPTVTPTVTPTPTITPTPTVTPTPTITPTPTVTPTPTPTPTITPTPTPTITPTPTPPMQSTYNGGNGNWSDPNSWTPAVVPNNGNQDADYDVSFAGGTLTQDIVDGVTINQLFMSGGTLILANPLTLDVGLEFSGGSIISGTLNVAGSSTQSATMGVNNTTINNSGTYDITFPGGDAFSGGGSVFNNSGTLTAHATDGTVNFDIPLNNTGTVSAEFGTFVLSAGGTLSGTASAEEGAMLEFGSNFTITDGAQFSGDGTVQFNNNTSTTFSGTIVNNGNVLIDSLGNYTDFVLNGDVTFSGSGVLTFMDHARIRGSGTFTNAGNTINGWTSGGSFGNNEIGIVNQTGGVIDANSEGLSLNVDPASDPGLTNTGVMEASDGGILVLNGNGGGGFNNTGGTITALDSSQVQLTNGAVVTGGIFSTVGSGTINVVNSATLVSVTNTGTFVGNNNSSTTVVGTLTNSGSFVLASAGNYTDLLLTDDVTLDGGGTISLVNADRIRGTGTLTNVDNIIEGETSNTGGLGYNEIGLINEASGLIDANVAGLPLVVDPNASAGMINRGTMEASNGGILFLTGNGGGGIDNTGGSILALDGSSVQLTAGIVITGGILNTVGSGAIHNINAATLDSLTNSGTFIADNNTTTYLTGTITDTGSITMNSTGNYTDLVVNADVTLTGGSTLTLANAARVLGSGTLYIGGSDGEAFTVEGETSNSGGFGYNQLAIVNRSGGLIDANQTNSNGVGLNLVVDPRSGGDVTNLGTMEASAGGILLLTGNGGGVFNNAGGLIEALTGSQVQLTAGATINNGTITTAGTGQFVNLDSATLNTLTLIGAFNANNNTTTTLVGTITNEGVISINSSGNYTDLLLSGNVTLTGGGTINITNAGRIRGSGILTNTNNLIQGDTSNSGSIGNNEIGIINQAAGLINANNSGFLMLIDPDSGDGLVNHGLIEASNGGILELTGNGGGTFTNTGATITALNGSTVRLTSGATLIGGTLSTVGTGQFVNLDTTTLTSLTNAGTFVANNNTTTILNGTINNTGTISLNSVANYTDLFLASNVTLTGGGTINLTVADRIRGSSGLILTNSNNLIQGDTNNSGSIGNNEIGIVNQAAGVINANNSGLVLLIDPDSGDGLVNQGLIEASNGGILRLTGNGGGAFTNTGATIEALTGSTVQLTNGANLIGGTLSTVGTGQFLNLDSATLTSLTNAGAFVANNNTTTTLVGTINNTGSISINGPDNFTDLYISGNVTLTGSGVINLTGSARLRGTGILTNAGNTIQGSGLIGNNEIGIVNQATGVIDANAASLALTLDPDSVDGLVNAGTMEATNDGVLELTGNGNGSFTNNRNIEADSGGLVQLDSGATLANNAVITAGAGGGVDLNGTVTGAGALLMGGGTMTINGSTSVDDVIGVSGELDIGANGNLTATGGLDFEGVNGGAGGSLTLTGPSLSFANGEDAINGANFNGGNAINSSNPGGDGGTLNAIATSGDLDVNTDIEASTGNNGANVTTGGTGGNVNLTANSGEVSVNNTIQVSHDVTGRKSKAGGSIALKSGKASGIAINISSTAQLLALLDAAAPGPSGKIVIQATATTGTSAINISGTSEADRGTIDARNFNDSGTVNLTNANLHADTVKVAALGTNGVLQIGGGSISADTTLQLYAPTGNGQVIFVGNVTLSGTSTKSIAGDSVTIENGVLVNVSGPAASVYVDKNVGGGYKANYTGFGGDGQTTGTFTGSGANAPQPLQSAPPLGNPPGH